ncbi:phosphoinositide 3-kinase regulatory subunit 6 isoform X2 [Lates calcarifer]|uniref:Phosphoinositide 3-kinase regulatory subunit 6 isoform X2 n=2 Tax=Lates calcarifer TaxID=8187 RepID=A0AAJ8BB66_LATCA|nr:phosphoinositide 3-kinase regulatory subunit 6 isoform X2 [Lates calcarifer]
MVDVTADGALAAMETSLHKDLQALLKGMNSRSGSLKGMLRWNLEKKIKTDPSCSVSLITVLVKELEKKLKRIHERPFSMHIIPMLHTLYYTALQSGFMIPTSLYKRVYKCLTNLLILPLPLSAVALSTLKSIKMEMTTPGSLYQRRIIAEQNLRNKHFTLQEKVFVLADPAVFSAPLEATVRAYLEVSSSFRDTPTIEKNLIIHVLQKGLGTACQSSRLAQALEALGDQMVAKHFDRVVLVMEQSIRHGAAGSAAYMNRLQHIHGDILTAVKDERTEEDYGSVCSRAVPFPEIKFHLWENEDDLWNLLANFTLRSHSSVDEEEREKRDSFQSEDSGIETYLKQSDFDDTEQPLVRKYGSAFSRRNAFKSTKSADKLSLMKEKIDTSPGSAPVLKEDRRCHTARVVIMGDDRVLGRLTRAYHSMRERESKCRVLTKKLNLQLYYIPVMDVEPLLSSPDSSCQEEGRLSLASLLGRVDPWYNSNINSLRTEISKLAHTNQNEPLEQNLLLLDTLCYYLRCGTHPVNLPLYSAKMTRSSCDVKSVVEEVFVSHLEADIPEFRHLKEKKKGPSASRKKSRVVVFGAVITVKYIKTSLSKREVVKGEAPMTCGVVVTSEPAAVTPGQDCLTVSFDSVNPEFSTKIQTQNISIKTMEHRTLSVCLDKDSRRIYTDVQRIEISPCLDPGCNIRSRFSIGDERELPLNKYLDKVLSLPINTFTGVTL